MSIHLKYNTCITNKIASKSILIFKLPGIIGWRENVNITNTFGAFLFSCVIFLLSCLGENMYVSVLSGILSGCIISIIIHYANYKNEMIKFILYTCEELKNILI